MPLIPLEGVAHHARVGRLCLAVLPLLAALVPACVEVKPWERGTLAHPAMNPSDPCRLAADDFVHHSFDVREGATGGSGTAGGGCGCN